MTVDVVLAALQPWSFRSSTEAVLQEAIAEALRHAGLAFEREASLSRSERIDFLVAGGIGIEVKIDGTPSAIVHQLYRYAKQDAIHGLVLFTTKRRLAFKGMLGGKTVVTFSPELRL